MMSDFFDYIVTFIQNIIAIIGNFFTGALALFEYSVHGTLVLTSFFAYLPSVIALGCGFTIVAMIIKFVLGR